MQIYKYIARDLSGERKVGLKQAGCQNDVLGWLREQGFTPVCVNEISTDVKKARQKVHRKRIKSADLTTFCWQLSTMIEGGVPITSALETIAEETENLQLREVLQQVLENIKKGETISDSISKFPKVFNHLFCAMVLAGETGGNLPHVLQRLAEYFDNSDKLAKKVKGAMAYPAFIFTFIILIVVFIMTFIIPRFRVIFDQIGGELPVFTRVFMGFYNVVRYNIVYIVGFVVLLVVSGVLTYTKSKKGHFLFCKIVLVMPLLGKIFRQSFLAMFCRTMSTLIASGVSVLEVFDILSVMSSNDIIGAAITRAKDHVVEGSNISFGMAASGFFPNMAIKMIQVGEESGSLSRVLDKTASYYERKVDTTITMVMALLEPIMIVTVGAIVSVVVLALYLPIFSISQ